MCLYAKESERENETPPRYIIPSILALLVSRNVTTQAPCGSSNTTNNSSNTNSNTNANTSNTNSNTSNNTSKRNSRTQSQKKSTCRNCSFAFATKARACKVTSQEGSRGSHFMLSGVQESVREWTFTLPRQFPLGELESPWTPKFLRNNYMGQNPLDWGILYIIGNLLKCRRLKWACITHLDIWNISYGQKKGRESNWQFDSRPLKVRNRPDFLACRWHETYRWKVVDESYNFALDLISIGGLHTKLWGSKVDNFGTPTWESWNKKIIWMWASWRGTKYAIRGKVVASPKSGPWWVLWIRVCSWLILAPKVLQLCTNHLVLVLCRFVWVVDACHSF